MSLKRFGRWLSPALTLLSVALTVWLLVDHWDDLTSFSWHLNVGYLFLALLAHSAALAVTFWVWHLMIRRLDGFSDWRVNFRAYYISTLAKRLPSSLPFVSGRYFMYKEVNVPGAVVINCTLLENVLIGVAGVLAFLLLLPFYVDAVPRELALWFGALAVGALLLFILRPHFLLDLTNWLLRRLHIQPLDRRVSVGDLLVWTGLYMLPWFFAGLSLFWAWRGFTTDPGPDLAASFRISTLATLASLLNLILPGGLAIKELAMTTLLLPYAPPSSALVISLAYRLLHMANESAWGLLATAVGRRHSTPPDSEADALASRSAAYPPE